MAVAIPLLMVAAGVETAVVVGFSLAMAATGASSMMNQEASKVFGKDLVNIANIAGALYMASGGFGSGAEGATEAGAIESASGWDDAMVDFARAGGGGTAGPTAGAAASGMVTDPGYIAAEQQGGALQMAAQPAPVQAAPAAQPQGALQHEAITKLDAIGAQAPPTNNPLTDAFSKAGDYASQMFDKFKALDPKTQGALLQVGGSLLGGYMQGKSMEDQRNFEAQYRRGSGLPYWMKPSGGG